MENISTLIRVVISTLNDVEVRGKNNLDKMLGSINALETVAQIVESQTELQHTKEEEVNG